MTQIVPYTLVILCGHPGSGKSKLAEVYADSCEPRARILTLRSLIEPFLANLFGTEERNFNEPRCNSVAMYMDPFDMTGNRDATPVPLSYGELFDDFYDIRIQLPWTIWAAYLQTQIANELKKSDGARSFVVDDLLQRDECQFMSVIPNSTVAVFFLDGNPGKKVKHDKRRPSYAFREDIREAAGDVGFFELKTDREANETEEKSLQRCLRFIKTGLSLVPQQRQLVNMQNASTSATT